MPGGLATGIGLLTEAATIAASAVGAKNNAKYIKFIKNAVAAASEAVDTLENNVMVTPEMKPYKALRGPSKPVKPKPAPIYNSNLRGSQVPMQVDQEG